MTLIMKGSEVSDRITREVSEIMKAIREALK